MKETTKLQLVKVLDSGGENRSRMGEQRNMNRVVEVMGALTCYAPCGNGELTR
jgi:hypothetical protein